MARPDETLTTAPNREFGEMIAQGGHVTPSIESNPLTACTRIGILRFFETAEGVKKIKITAGYVDSSSQAIR